MRALCTIILIFTWSAKAGKKPAQLDCTSADEIVHFNCEVVDHGLRIELRERLGNELYISEEGGNYCQRLYKGATLKSTDVTENSYYYFRARATQFDRYRAKKVFGFSVHRRSGTGVIDFFSPNENTGPVEEIMILRDCRFEHEVADTEVRKSVNSLSVRRRGVGAPYPAGMFERQ